MRPAASGPLRLLRTLLHADHALVFGQGASGDVSLVAADPPQRPAPPFALDDPTLWPPLGAPLFSESADAIRTSPLGSVLAGAQGTMLAVSARAVGPNLLPPGTTGVSLYLLWQAPHPPPPHVRSELHAIAASMQEQLEALQHQAADARAGATLQVLLSALPNGVVLTDEAAGTAVVNAEAADLLGMAPGVLPSAAVAEAIEGLHKRTSRVQEVRPDRPLLVAPAGGQRRTWVWDVRDPVRRTLLVSALPVHTAEHDGHLWSFSDATAVRAAEAEPAKLLHQLEREQPKLGELLTSAPAMIMLLRGPEHVIEFANTAVQKAAGGADLIGKRLFIDYLPALHGTDFEAAHDAVFRTGDGWTATGVHLRANDLNGRPDVHVNVSIQALRNVDGSVSGLFVHATDVTAEVMAVEQLRQSQKLESIGRLTGGVAHDFNNLLTVIGGNTDLLLAELPPTTQAHADATEVKHAVRRAADLTHQLLSFSRRQVLQRHVVEVDPVVRGVEKLLRRVIGEDITLDTQLDSNGATVLIAPGQLEQVLVNLAVNARDAMPQGGRLSIRSSVQGAPSPTADGRAQPPLLRGTHLRLLVRDTGTGMDADTLARATEAFFTTKPVGQGTGLGLATVGDIMAQNGGAMWIESTPGTGTGVWLALPLAGGTSPVPEATPPVPRPVQSGTLLLVEDERGVRHITKRILEQAGYTVRIATNGTEGLRRWHEQASQPAQRFDGVITDVVMPDMSGRAMVRAMRAEDPQLRVLFVSGYAEGGLSDEELAGHTAFLAKPFTADALLQEVVGLLGHD